MKLSSLAVPRWINFKSTETKKVELHTFADASSKAYGAAAYVNVVNPNSKHCNLVLGKSKIAPMKNKLTTIPRLELQAALFFKNKTNCNTGNGHTHRQYLFMV